MAKGQWALAALLALATVTCDQAPLTAPVGSTLSLFANPTFIVANGGVSVISAFLTEPAGTTVPDGTVVEFFTDLGQIPPQGETKDGVARVNLLADSRSGKATINAFSGGVAASGTAEVDIGSGIAHHVKVTANPAAIQSNQWSTITANVFDENGNPLAHVPVIFDISSGTESTPGGVSETLDSGGAQLFTDTNGQVSDTLRSRRPLSDTGLVTVTATTSAGTGSSDMVEVAIN
jgi:hypothetical protein